MAFLKKIPDLSAIASKIIFDARANLNSAGLLRTKSYSRNLGPSLRFFKVSTKDGTDYKFSMNWYGLNILEAAYPAGKKWGRGRLKNPKTAQMWFTPALEAHLDEITLQIENDIANDIEQQLVSELKK